MDPLLPRVVFSPEMEANAVVPPQWVTFKAEHDLEKDGCAPRFESVMWGEESVCMCPPASLEMICESRRRSCPPLISAGKGHFLAGLQPDTCINVCVCVCVCVCVFEEVGG